ncbi:MAG: P-type conjugative transfer protein TrbL [Bryobacteraceae bacterium]
MSNRLQTIRTWKRSHRHWLLVVVIASLFTQAALAQAPFNTTVPGDIMTQFRNQRITWTTNVWVYANALFGILAVIEFAWSAAVMLLEKSDLQSWTSALVRKIMWIGAFYALLINGRIWIPAIIDSFTQIGAGAAGLAGPLNPGDVFMQGIAIAGALLDAASSSAFFTNPGSSLALAFAALLIVVSYIVITINFLVTFVESYLIISVGFLFLGFGGSRWTAPYVERYIGLAVAIGIKIVLLYCLIAAGLGLGNGWLAEAQGVGTSAHPSMTAFDVMGAALIFMMLCWQIPKLFAAVLGGAPALTGGDLISTGVMVASAGVAVASAGTSAVGALAGGASALAGTGSAAAAGSSGSSGVASSVAGVSAASGAGSAAGGSVPPPSAGTGAAGSSGGVRRQPDPPMGTSNHSSLASVGGEPLAGSGFESESPARGFSPSSNGMHSEGPSSGGQTSAASSVSSQAEPPPPQPPAPERKDRRTGSVAEGIQRLRRRLPALPSDAAPHATPPRMPIDHHE